MMPDPAQSMSLPGSPEALDRGCVCSVLLNRLSGGAEQGFVNPLCPLHAPTAPPPEAPTSGGSDGRPDR